MHINKNIRNSWRKFIFQSSILKRYWREKSWVEKCVEATLFKWIEFKVLLGSFFSIRAIEAKVQSCLQFVFNKLSVRSTADERLPLAAKVNNSSGTFSRILQPRKVFSDFQLWRPSKCFRLVCDEVSRKTDILSVLSSSRDEASTDSKNS